MAFNRFGRLVAPDANDARYPMRAALQPRPVAAFRNYRIPTEMPLDQGDTGTCVFHAWIEFLMVAPIMRRSTIHPYDAYREGVLFDEFPQNDHEATAPTSGLQFGSSIRGGAKWAQSKGFLKSYVWAANAEEMALWILTGQGTVVVGTDWHADMSTLDRNYYARPTGGVLGGHAYLVTGYHRQFRRFACINSWGAGFGFRGRFYLSHDHMDELVRREGGEACAAVEKRVILPIAEAV